MAASRPSVTKRSVGLTFAASTVPPSTVVVPLNAGAPTTVAVDSSGRMQEGNSGTSGSPFLTATLWGEVMNTDFYDSSVQNANVATTDRAIGAGLSNSDGTRIIFFFMAGNTNAARIQTLIGGVLADRGTSAAVYSASGADILTLRPAIAGADIVWTVYKGGVPTAVTWTDTNGATFGWPGRYPCGIFRHFYQGGTQYKSPGIRSWSANDL